MLALVVRCICLDLLGALETCSCLSSRVQGFIGYHTGRWCKILPFVPFVFASSQISDLLIYEMILLGCEQDLSRRS